MSTKQQRQKGAKQKHRRPSGSPNTTTEPKISFQQRLNPVYLEEEAKIQELIEPRRENLDEPTQSDLEVLFFTEGLPKDLDCGGSESSFKSLDSNELHDTQQTNYLDSIVQIEEDMLFDRVKEEIKYDKSLLYYPSSEKPSLPNVESTTIPSLESQGIHEIPLPNLNQKNKHLLYNRLLEEDKYHLFNKNGELSGLCDQTQPSHNGKLFRFESNKEFPVKFVLVDEQEFNAKERLEESKVLLLKVEHLKFYHHHLFSEENFLAHSIEKAYQAHVVAKRAGGPQKFLQKIAILKCSMEELTKESEQYKKRLVDILELRNKYHLDSKLQKDRVQMILEDYKALKALRKSQQFNSTTLKLTITVDSVNESPPQMLEELLEEEIQETFALQNLEYLEAKKDRKQRRKSSTPEELDNLPALPAKPNLESIKSTLRKKFKDCHFDINQYRVDFLLNRTPRTAAPENNTAEQKRISSFYAVKYQLKVFCNNEPIGILHQINTSEDFEVNFYSSISIRLTDKLPDQIRIDIMEERPLKPKIKLTKIFIPVPRFHEGNIEADSSFLEFTSSKSIQSDAGIGSGQFCIRKNQQQLINGFLSLKIGWKDTGRSTSIPQNTMTSSSLQRIIQDPAQFDPMNPDVDYNMMRSANEDSNDDEDADENSKEFFFLEDELTFCSEEELKNNQRNKILRERARKNKKYKDFKLVPTSDRQMEDYEVTERIIDKTLGMDPIDLQRYRGKKYLNEVYCTISDYCKSLNEESNENLLLTEKMPTLASMVTAFFQLFGPNRPLKPTRKRQGSHRPSCRNIDVKQLKVSLNIVRAFGIPHRHDDALISTRKSSNMSSPNTSGYRPINIRPFITTTFKEISARTSTGDGSNPTWNEQLTIPLSLRKLDDLKGCLSIQLFDEYVEDILEDDRNRLTDIYQRISSKFIGELRIPLMDLYFSQRIEGTFEMNSPPLVGYTKTSIRNPQSQSAPSSSFANSNIIPDLKGPIYVSLLINLEPYFEHDYFTTKHLECTETDQLKNTIGLWMYDFHLEFPHRSIDPYVTLLNGKRVFIMNLLGPINTPFAETTEKEKLEALVRRYVSLIPTLQTTDPCVQRSGVWLLNDQIFNTLRCSQKDLAVILTNFYLEIGLEAWLMIGESQLRKNSCFVLLKESSTEYFIVDPVTGRKYQSTDTYCPLTSIHFLINDQNLFGNIQVERKVFMTRFDVKDSSDWRSLLKKPQDFSRAFLQEQNYPFKISYDIRNIQYVIETKLAKKISQWRGHRKTIWNRLVRDNLRRILIELEKDATEFTDNNGDHLEKLNFLNNNFKVSGCPLHMRYLNLSHIVERVKATGIHLNTDPRVEFGFSVYVHPYPNFIISVWVFLIALLPK